LIPTKFSLAFGGIEKKGPKRKKREKLAITYKQNKNIRKKVAPTETTGKQ